MGFERIGNVEIDWRERPVVWLNKVPPSSDGCDGTGKVSRESSRALMLAEAVRHCGAVRTPVSPPTRHATRDYLHNHNPVEDVREYEPFGRQV